MNNFFFVSVLMIFMCKFNATNNVIHYLCNRLFFIGYFKVSLH